MKLAAVEAAEPPSAFDARTADADQLGRRATTQALPRFVGEIVASDEEVAAAGTLEIDMGSPGSGHGASLMGAWSARSSPSEKPDAAQRPWQSR